MDHSTQDKQLNDMILSGKIMEAFEQFYAEDVVMQENNDAPCNGKEANRARELAFLGNVEQFHGMQMTSSAVNSDVSFSEWVADVTLKGMPRMNMQQVSVRRWKDGEVKHERFYYNKG